MSKNKNNNQNHQNNKGGNDSKAAMLSRNKIKAKNIQAGTELIMPVKVTVYASEEYGSELPFNTNLWYIDADVRMPGTGKNERIQIICSHNDEYLYVTVPDQRPVWKQKLSRAWNIVAGIFNKPKHKNNNNHHQNHKQNNEEQAN